MANLISVTAKQIGTGLPLTSSETVLVAPNEIARVLPTQNQSGGGTPYDRLCNPSVAAAVYSRIETKNGGGKYNTFLFCTDKVAEVLSKANAALT